MASSRLRKIHRFIFNFFQIWKFKENKTNFQLYPCFHMLCYGCVYICKNRRHSQHCVVCVLFFSHLSFKWLTNSPIVFGIWVFCMQTHGTADKQHNPIKYINTLILWTHKHTAVHVIGLLVFLSGNAFTCQQVHWFPTLPLLSLITCLTLSPPPL